MGIWIIFSVIVFVMTLRVINLNFKIAEAMDKKVFDRNFKTKILENVIINCISIIIQYGLIKFAQPFDIVSFTEKFCLTIRYNLLFLCYFYDFNFTSRRKKVKDNKENMLELKITISLSMCIIILSNILILIGKEGRTSLLIFNAVGGVLLLGYIIKKLKSLKHQLGKNKEGY